MGGEIDLGLDPDDNEIDWKGDLTLPAGVTLDPVAEGMALRLESADAMVFETAIAPGMFAPQGPARVQVRVRAGRDAPDVEGTLLVVPDRTAVTGTLAIGNKVGTEVLPLTDKGKRLEFKK